ncbi:MAG: hypothetical protein KGM24_02515 [Elusimicrobia bacterium]|nr:hypothetical protein [Elusimicrobiota bacterium]
MAGKIDLKPYVELVTEEISMVVRNVKEKGGKRFGRAFGIAGVVIFIAYAGVYAPPQTRSARLQKEIDEAKLLEHYGEQYDTTISQLDAAYARLPTMKDRDQWLFNSVRDSLDAGGLVTESFKPVKEVELQGLIYQVCDVTLSLRFGEFYDWLLRLESAKPLMQLQTLDLAKTMDSSGYNEASCEIATVIPKRRYH